MFVPPGSAVVLGGAQEVKHVSPSCMGQKVFSRVPMLEIFFISPI